MEADNKRTCETCGYFWQHYIWSGRYLPVYYGHCVHLPRNRQCRPGMAACNKWIPQDEEYQKTYLPPK